MICTQVLEQVLSGSHGCEGTRHSSGVGQSGCCGDGAVDGLGRSGGHRLCVNQVWSGVGWNDWEERGQGQSLRENS